ncbi:MAG TPA: VanZ family protein, partial [Thermomicrobiales bacterium]|nr:VanZ family protein [Thermomicrobiales bacterium]
RGRPAWWQWQGGEQDLMRRAGRSHGQRIIRPIPALAALLWMGAIFALSARSTVPVPPGLTTELTSIAGHFCAYAALSALLWWAIEPRAMPARQRMVLALAVAVLYGLTDEWHQSFVPGRDASLLDIVVDGIGALCGLALVQRVADRESATDG